jgi:hypothetical protein
MLAYDFFSYFTRGCIAFGRPPGDKYVSQMPGPGAERVPELQAMPEMIIRS